MTQTFVRPAITALALALAIGSLAMPAAAQTPPDVPAAPGAPGSVGRDATLLSISATGEASRAPDIATVSAGVVTQGTDANAALRANAGQMSQVIAAIRAAGVAERDIQTTGINIHPNYRHVDNEEPRISGYNANNSVNVRVRDVARLGEVLDALVASGANNVNGPSFGIDQPEAVYDEARRKALEQGRARADMYARTLGLQVRRIVSISEGGGMHRPQPVYALAARAMGDASTPVAAGENTLSANLEIVFELGR